MGFDLNTQDDSTIKRPEKMELRRFLLFCGDSIPRGGFDDLLGSFNSHQKAVEEGEQKAWFHVYDLNTRITTRGGLGKKTMRTITRFVVTNEGPKT